MKIHIKPALIGSTAKLALLAAFCTPLNTFAQTSANDDSRVGLDEIVVTAERREDSVNDVAVAITAFDEVAFERIQAVDLEDFHLKSPNVTIVKSTTTTNSAQVFIRGIGRDDSTWNVESGAAIYVDGVYLPQQNGALLDLVEFERVEILRGPQGALYGKSATGGTIKFVSKKPDLDKMTAVGDVTLGSFDRLDVRGSVGVPIVESKLAAKLDFVSRDDAGFIQDSDSGEKYNGNNRQSGRLSLLWEASDNIDVFAAIDVAKDRSPIAVPTPSRVDTGGFGTFNDPDGDGIASSAFGSNFIANPGINNVNEFDGRGALAQINWDLGSGTLTSLTSFRGYDYALEGDLDGQTLVPLEFFQDVDSSTFQQEVTYASNFEGAFNFVVGGYYIKDKIDFISETFFNGVRSDSNQDTDSIAIYGEGTFDFNEWLSVTGGARYSKDTKDITQSGYNLTQGPSGVAAFGPVNVKESFDALTPKFVVELKPFVDSDAIDLLLYAQYQEGFKTGGAAFGRPANAVQAATLFGKEDSDNIEFGAKATLFDNRLQVNAAYFMMNQDNLAGTVLDPATNEISVVTADAEMDGLELEAIANPVEGLTLFGTLATLSDAIVRAEPGSPFVVGVSELKHKPDWHFVLGAEYEREISGGGTIGIGGTYSSSDEIVRNVANTPNIISPKTDIIDARIYFDSPNETWGVELAGQNLTNEEYWTQGISTFGRFYAPESTWSLRFKAKI